MRGIVYDNALVRFCPDKLRNAFPDTIEMVDVGDLHESVRIGLDFVGQLVAKGTDRQW